MPLIEDGSRPSSMAVATRCTTAPIAAPGTLGYRKLKGYQPLSRRGSGAGAAGSRSRAPASGAPA